MSYYGIGDDPRNRFRQLPRVKRSRSPVGNIRGGGSIGLPNRNQLMGAQPPAQSIPQRQTLGGGSSITTGPEQTPPEQQGLLGGLLQAKGAYEGVKEAATGGKNIRKAYNEFDFKTSKLNPSNWGGASTTANSGQLSSPAVANASTNTTTAPQFTLANPNINQNFNPTSGSLIRGGVSPQTSQLSAGVPQNYGIVGGNTWGQAIANTGATGSTLAGDVVGAGSKYAGGAGTAGVAGSAGSQGAKATTGLQTGADAASGGSNVLGGAAAGLGVGLNAYDISQNGLNFGNAAGLAGSAILAGTTMMGLANAWNPVGWALLAGSAAYSIFG